MKGFDPIKGFEKVGKAVGQELGSSVGKLFGGKRGEQAGRNIGGAIGEAGAPLAATALAFKTGGKVPGKKGKAVKAIVHGGEFILSASIKPTKAQIKATKALKAKEAKEAKKKK